MKYRSMQMMLVIFYAEELKRKVVGCVRATNRFRNVGGLPAGSFQKSLRNEVKQAFEALRVDGVLTEPEYIEIRQLIDFRNAIAHELQNLLADLSNETVAKKHVEFSRNRLAYDYSAAEKLKHYNRLLGRRLQQCHFVISVSFDPLIFGAAERTFLTEIDRLRHRINRLYADRKREIAVLETELSLEGTGLTEKNHPRAPLSQYDNGRLTARGVEICYRLFDLGRSTVAVAYLTGLSLPAVRRRRKMWQAAGGRNRIPVDLEALPERKFYRRYDDD